MALPDPRAVEKLPTAKSRRSFCIAGAAALATLRPQLLAQSSAARTRADVAAIDHDRILAAASRALTQPVPAITELTAHRSPGGPHDFYSEPEDFFPDPAAPTGPWLQRRPSPANPMVANPDSFTAHRDAVDSLGETVAALTAAFALTGEARYAAKAAEPLRAWFANPATRMNPSLQFGQRIPNSNALRFEGVLETIPLAEVAHSIRFLASAGALTDEEIKTIRAWFAEYAVWLNDSRIGGLSRDQKDHHASSWLFQCAAFADANVIGFTSDDATLDKLRHRFRTATLRAEISSFGFFPHDVDTPAPYRNSLLNLDLLALVCELLTTRFENAWEYELQDGPGMRSAIAYHYPFLLNRAQWPYPSDLSHFKELPGRRISLLLAGHAYSRPEYVDLWKSLKPLPDATAPELLRSVPITQPLLWTSHARP